MKVGILGGGQLGRMLALAGYPLDLSFIVLDPAPDAPAAPLATHLRADYDDPGALDQLAAAADVVTYEFENVPVASAHRLVSQVPVLPPPAALAAAQDRLAEKRLFQRLDIPTAAFSAVSSDDELRQALREVGLPAVLKTRRLGYDGKGQAVLRSERDVDLAWRGMGGAPLLLESFIAFERELSILAVRDRGGETAFYPLVENHHVEGILRLSRAPAPGLTGELQAEAEGHATQLLRHFDYAGVLAIELFQVGGRLLANEIAPRVHNSGHWTIEGAQTSQFENHLRAVTGLPLGSTAPTGVSAMVNLIGVVPDHAALLSIPCARTHLYGKTPRPGRKLGHVTIRSADEAQVESALASLLDLVR